MRCGCRHGCSAIVALLLVAGACSDDNGPTPDAGVDAGLDAEAGTDPDGRCSLNLQPADPVPTPTIHTPRWAFEPWISKDISDTADTYAFVDGFDTHQIPVGVVVLDSPWETNYNTFIPNPERYPDFEKLIQEMHARGIRVVLWITQMVNKASFDLEHGGDTYPDPSPNFEEGLRCSLFVNKGRTYVWWKGVGAGVDFFNPLALSWWHRQQDHVLELGIDGWKLDFGESYIPTTEVETAKGKVPHQEYSEEYYRDFLAYGVLKRGKEFVTMVRGYDKSYQFDGRFFARPEHAPVVWAGDNRRDWIGLADALDHIFRSARAGYVVVGSDIGGYLDLDDKTQETVPFDQDAFVRWAAVGALCPFMQLHGRQNLTPWTVTPKTTETLAIYRYWSWLHHELVPFWYSLAQEAYEAYKGGQSLLRPVGEPTDWPGDYRYELGEALLVAPILDGTGKRDVPLPAGSKWLDWWRPGDPPLDGGQTIPGYDATDQQQTVPLFIKEGAIIPAEVSSDVTGLGSAKSKGHLTVLVYPGPKQTSFALHEQDDQVTTVTASAQQPAGTSEVKLSRVTRPTILRVRAESPPTSVSVDGAASTARASVQELETAATGFFSDAASRLVWIKLAAKAGTCTVVIQ